MFENRKSLDEQLAKARKQLNNSKTEQKAIVVNSLDQLIAAAQAEADAYNKELYRRKKNTDKSDYDI